MTDLRKAAQQATPRADLLAELMDSNEPKTEREHAAVYEIERLRAALAQPAVPEGWVLVPVEPTHNMVLAGCLDSRMVPSMAEVTYRAMLASAPKGTTK